MNKKLDLPIGTIGSALAGIFFALVYNWLMGRYMIGYSLNSSIVSGGILGALIGAPLSYLALKETGKVLITTVVLAISSVAVLALLKLPLNFVVPVSISFAAAFGCVALVMDRIFNTRASFGYFASTGFLVGVGLFLANTMLGMNKGFSWQGVFMIGIDGLICAVGAYFPLMMLDIHRSMKLDRLT